MCIEQHISDTIMSCVLHFVRQYMYLGVTNYIMHSMSNMWKHLRLELQNTPNNYVADYYQRTLWAAADYHLALWQCNRKSAGENCVIMTYTPSHGTTLYHTCLRMFGKRRLYEGAWISSCRLLLSSALIVCLPLSSMVPEHIGTFW